MDPGRPKQPTGEGVLPGQPALESVVQAHSDQLIKLNRDLSSALALVTGEVGSLRTSSASTSTVFDSLDSRVATLTGLVTQLFPAPAGDFQAAPLLHSITITFTVNDLEIGQPCSAVIYTEVNLQT